MSADDIYNRATPKSEYPDFVKLEPGQTLAGAIQAVRTVTFKSGDEEIVLDVVDQDFGRGSLVCGTIKLQTLVLTNRPQEGDWIVVQRLGNTGDAHNYTMDVSRGAGVNHLAAFNQAQASTSDFAGPPPAQPMAYPAPQAAPMPQAPAPAPAYPQAAPAPQAPAPAYPATEAAPLAAPAPQGYPAPQAPAPAQEVGQGYAQAPGTVPAPPMPQTPPPTPRV